MEDFEAIIEQMANFWLVKVFNKKIDAYHILSVHESMEEAVSWAAESGYNSSVRQTTEG